MNGIKCGDCGKFIAFKDFEESKVRYRESFYYGDWLDPPELEPICSKCVEREKH